MLFSGWSAVSVAAVEIHQMAPGALAERSPQANCCRTYIYPCNLIPPTRIYGSRILIVCYGQHSWSRGSSVFCNSKSDCVGDPMHSNIHNSGSIFTNSEAS